MIQETLNLWGKGAITLPKKWRDQFPTKHFMAIAKPEGLLIKPILDVEYYERRDGSVGLRFLTGIEAGELADSFGEVLDKMKKSKRRKRSQKSS